MHCDDVIRELAVPTDDRDTAALAQHLASCSQCSEWAKKDAQFERLWNVTRPSEPSSQVWDEVWSHLRTSLDSPRPVNLKASTIELAPLNGSVSRLKMPLESPPTQPRSRSWKWAAIALVGLAQAAAILLAVNSAWRISARSAGPGLTTSIRSPAPSNSPPAVKQSEPLLVPVVEIEAGQSVVIRVDDSATQVLVLTHDGISSSVDDWYLVFNAIEAIANPVVAMKE
jgi:hypothetical protein